jgi:hypothetical protein
MTTQSLEVRQQKKVLRTLTRLKHTLAADRDIEELLEQHARVGAEGMVPRLETTLAELLGSEL